MTDYSDFPPIKYFIRVLKTCPKSAFLYTQLWKKKRNMILNVEKGNIRKDFLISPTMFRNHIAPLAYLNLLQFQESDERYQLELLGND